MNLSVCEQSICACASDLSASEQIIYLLIYRSLSKVSIHLSINLSIFEQTIYALIYLALNNLSVNLSVPEQSIYRVIYRRGWRTHHAFDRTCPSSSLPPPSPFTSGPWASTHSAFIPPENDFPFPRSRPSCNPLQIQTFPLLSPLVYCSSVPHTHRPSPFTPLHSFYL